MSLLDRDENLKVKLAQIDKHLKKLKEMANELLKAENVLHLKAISFL